MSDGRGVAAQGLHTLASRVTIYVSGFASSILIARGLGADDRGLYALPIALITIAAALASQGLDLAQVRVWARGAAERAYLPAAAGWLAVGAGATVAGLTWAVYEVGRSGPFERLDRLDLALVVVLLPMWVHSVLARGLLVMAGAITAANRALVAGDLCRTVGVVALYVAGELDVRNVLLLFATTIVVPWALCVRAARGLPRAPAARPPGAVVRELTRLGLSLSPQFVFLTLLMRVDVLLLAQYRPLDEVGAYAVAVLVAELLWLPTWALAQPVRAHQSNLPRDAAVRMTARTVRMTLALSVVSGALLALAAPLLIRPVFGAEFDAAVSAVWPLLLAAAAMAAWRPVSVVLVRLAPAWIPAVIALAALAVNVVANLILIPAWGIVGAGVASALGYGAGALAALAVLVRAGGVDARDLVPRRAEVAELLGSVRPSFVRRQLAWLRARRHRVG
jgi:O-antigen/teichoic acid export membrane protein